jgi:hypothetical protein
MVEETVMSFGSSVWGGKSITYGGRKLQVYKTVAVHNLLPPDGKARILYCRWFQESEFNELLDPELILYSDSHFKWLHKQPK